MLPVQAAQQFWNRATVSYDKVGQLCGIIRLLDIIVQIKNCWLTLDLSKHLKIYLEGRLGLLISEVKACMTGKQLLTHCFLPQTPHFSLFLLCSLVRFRSKYHPDEAGRRKAESHSALQNRLSVYMYLMDNSWFESVSLDIERAPQITKILDAGMEKCFSFACHLLTLMTFQTLSIC